LLKEAQESVKKCIFWYVAVEVAKMAVVLG
jgi:hypothetical protein